MASPEAARRVAERRGRRAERLAAWYLRCKGYRILASRYRNHLGEIDLVAERGNTLVAIEVKARQNLADCTETVPQQKQEKIARALEGFLAGHRPHGAGVKKSTGLATARADNIRFDVIWIAPRRWPVHIKDAWRPR